MNREGELEANKETFKQFATEFHELCKKYDMHLSLNEIHIPTTSEPIAKSFQVNWSGFHYLTVDNEQVVYQKDDRNDVWK